VYSAAGGVAQNLISLLKHLQVKVIGVANTAEKCRIAKEAGASQVTLDAPEQILETVAKYTNDRGVDVLFDSVGKALFDTSLQLLRKKGLFIHYGANSGALGLIDPMQLANVGSIYFVRPRLNDHIGTRAELLERSYQLFELWGILKQSTVPSRIYELDEVSAAHQALETRQSIGKSILRIAQ
jgi:NADPH2:quinone reductase